MYPSIEMVRTRAKLPAPRFLHLGLPVSVLDPLGPLVELTERTPNVANGANNPGVPFLALFTPRVELEVAAPELSKNLVVGIGGAFRLYRMDGTPSGGYYCVLGRADPGCNTSPTSGNVELSAFVKYVP